MQAKQLGRRVGRALRPADDMADDPAGDLAGDLAGNMAGDPAGQVAATTLTWLRPGSAVLAIRQAIRHVTGSSHTGGMASSLASTHADGLPSSHASSLSSKARQYFGPRRDVTATDEGATRLLNEMRLSLLRALRELATLKLREQKP